MQKHYLISRHFQQGKGNSPNIVFFDVNIEELCTRQCHWSPLGAAIKLGQPTRHRRGHQGRSQGPGQVCSQGIQWSLAPAAWNNSSVRHTSHFSLSASHMRWDVSSSHSLAGDEMWQCVAAAAALMAPLHAVHTSWARDWRCGSISLSPHCAWDQDRASSCQLSPSKSEQIFLTKIFLTKRITAPAPH